MLSCFKCWKRKLPSPGSPDKPAAAAVRVVAVRLPPGPVQVGAVLQLEAEATGELVEIRVPPGARPGAVLQVEVPDVEPEPPSLEEYFLRGYGLGEEPPAGFA